MLQLQWQGIVLKMARCRSKRKEHYLILYGEDDAVQHLELLEDLVGDRVEGDGQQKLAVALTHPQRSGHLDAIRLFCKSAEYRASSAPH